MKKLKKSLDFGASTTKQSSERVMEAMFPLSIINTNDGSLSMVPPKDVRAEDMVVERKDVVPLKKKTKNS